MTRLIVVPVQNGKFFAETDAGGLPGALLENHSHGRGLQIPRNKFF